MNINRNTMGRGSRPGVVYQVSLIMMEVIFHGMWVRTYEEVNSGQRSGRVLVPNHFLWNSACPEPTRSTRTGGASSAWYKRYSRLDRRKRSGANAINFDIEVGRGSL
jgi:hypothetical protein